MAKEYLRGASGSEDIKVSTNSFLVHGTVYFLVQILQICEVQIGKQKLVIRIFFYSNWHYICWKYGCIFEKDLVGL